MKVSIKDSSETLEDMKKRMSAELDKQFVRNNTYAKARGSRSFASTKAFMEAANLHSGPTFG